MTGAAPIRPTEARIDLRALAHNTRQLREAIGPDVGIIAVVKADAYGHGAVEIARLLEGLGMRALAVATVEEAEELRRAGVQLPLLTMGAAYGTEHDAVVAHGLTPTVGDPGDVERFAAAASRCGVVRFGIHLKVDTGMSRLGVTAAEFDALLRQAARFTSIRVDGLATHFASADEADPGPTLRQRELFVRCLDRARAMGADPQLIHAANSAAALRFPSTRFDMVRPGLVLYGAHPSPHVPRLDLQPVMSLWTRINALRQLPPKTPVGYGGSFVTSRTSLIATLPVGYADGYSRALSGRAQVLVGGKRAPLVGRVCMDLCMVDVTEVDGVQVGQAVQLMGGAGGPSAEDLAAWAGTIPYEILCSISKRVPRVYPAAGSEAGRSVEQPSTAERG